MKPQDHAIPVQADETRSSAVCCRGVGGALESRRLVIAAKGNLLVVDLSSGRCSQHFFPAAKGAYPYASYAGSDGMYYTGAGSQFMVFDPFAEEYVYTADVPGGNVGFSFAEDDFSHIWFAVQGSCGLFRYDPKAGGVEPFGQLDAEQSYPSTLAADRLGWVYAGLGTTCRKVVAVMPETGERCPFTELARPGPGLGYVFKGTDGNVYGHFELTTAGLSCRESASPPDVQWYRFEGGRASPIGASQVAPSVCTGHGYRQIHGHLPPPWQLLSVELEQRRVVIGNSTRKQQPKHVSLSYESTGAQLSSLAVGPDGLIYGTSGHPEHFFTYDPGTNRTTDYGGEILDNGSGGNICAYTSLGSCLYGARYPHGRLYCIDTNEPISDGATQCPANPRVVASCRQVYRPRCCLTHPDNRRILFAGYAGYGEVGGGLGIYDVMDETLEVTLNERLVPGHSFVSLVANDCGTVFGGTCVNSPGGAQPVANEGCLTQLAEGLDRVVNSWTPLPGARSLIALAPIGESCFLVMSSCGRLANFDSGTGTTVSTVDLAGYGKPVSDGILVVPGLGVYILMNQSILRYDENTFTVYPLIKLPEDRLITKSGVVQGRRLYFTSGARLCSVDLC